MIKNHMIKTIKSRKQKNRQLGCWHRYQSIVIRLFHPDDIFSCNIVRCLEFLMFDQIVQKNIVDKNSILINKTLFFIQDPFLNTQYYNNVLRFFDCTLSFLSFYSQKSTERANYDSLSIHYRTYNPAWKAQTFLKAANEQTGDQYLVILDSSQYNSSSNHECQR